MLPLLHLSVSNIQLSTIIYNSLPVRHTNQLSYPLLPFAVVLVDSDIASLPVYHHTLACNHYDTVLRHILEIYCRIEGLLFESLITY
jgi:hypothetical protein